MGKGALAWWRVWKPIVLAAVKAAGGAESV